MWRHSLIPGVNRAFHSILVVIQYPKTEEATLVVNLVCIQSYWKFLILIQQLPMPEVQFSSDVTLLAPGDVQVMTVVAAPGDRAKESSKSRAQLDVVVTTERRKVALARRGVCFSASLCAGRKGLGHGEWNWCGLVGRGSDCTDSLTPADCVVFPFCRLFWRRFFILLTSTKGTGAQSFIVDHKSTRLCLWEMKDWRW